MIGVCLELLHNPLGSGPSARDNDRLHLTANGHVHCTDIFGNLIDHGIQSQCRLLVSVGDAFFDGNDIVYHGFQDVGVAVSSERGLVVPVLRNAENMSVADIEHGVYEYAMKAREGKLSIEEMSGGTFTITNGGVFGSLLSTPIINPPQTAILGMHKIQDRPVAINGEVVIRPMMYLALSYDHRLIDGKEAVQFLVAIKEMIENPAKILLEI